MSVAVAQRSAPGRLLPEGIALALFLGMYWGSVTSLWAHWTSGLWAQGAHGLPLFAIVAVLVYLRWRAERPMPASGIRLGAVGALALLSVGWALAGLAQLRIGQDLAFLFMAFPLFWAVFGYRQGASLSWPLLLLLTAIPVWDALYPVQREITTAGTVWTMNLLGISTLREGYTVIVPAGNFLIDWTCAGIAQFTSSLAVTGLYAFIERLTLTSTFLLVCMGWAVASLGNVVRVVIIVWAGQATGMQHWLLADHAWLGWIVFAIGITALLLVVGRRLPRSQAPVTSELSPPAFRPTTGMSWRASCRRLCILLLAVSIGPVVLAGSRLAPIESPLSMMDWPIRLGQWERSNAADSDWRPSFEGADREQVATYHAFGAGTVDAYLATYLEQRQGKEVVSDDNRTYDRRRWQEVDSRRLDVDLGDEKLIVEEISLRGASGDTRVVWHWYEIGGRYTSNAVETKAYGMAAAIAGDRRARAFVVSTRANGPLDKARAELRNFVGELIALDTGSHNPDP
jgi:EpsI family protein